MKSRGYHGKKSQAVWEICGLMNLRQVTVALYFRFWLFAKFSSTKSSVYWFHDRGNISSSHLMSNWHAVILKDEVRLDWKLSLLLLEIAWNDLHGLESLYGVGYASFGAPHNIRTSASKQKQTKHPTVMDWDLLIIHVALSHHRSTSTTW